MFDSRVEPSSRSIVSEAQCRGPAGVHESGGTMEEHESERLNCLEHRQCRVLARASPAFCPSLDLKVRE